MLDANNEVEYPSEATETEEYTMTCLGRLVFTDKHCRQSLILHNSSKERIDSLSLAYEDLFTMPDSIIDDYSSIIQHLDISNNMFNRNLQFLSEFDNLKSLNLDHNRIDDTTVFPYMPNLELLWLNHNSINNLYPFVKDLQRSVPNLKYLCLMGNNAAPSYLNGGSFFDYLHYRLYVLSWFPNLLHLDDRVVTKEQLSEAKRLFKRPLFGNLVALPECFKDLHNKMPAFSKLMEHNNSRSKRPRETNFVI